MIAAANGDTFPQIDGFKYAGLGILSGETYTEVKIAGDGTSVVNVYYKRLSYTLTINYLYGDTDETLATSASNSYAYGQAYDVKAIEIKGYSYVSGEESGNMLADDKTINIRYKEITYTISYNVDGGNALIGLTKDGDYYVQTYTVRAAAALAQPTKTGYEFEYWKVHFNNHKR